MESDGIKLEEVCVSNNMIIGNTFIKPKTEKNIGSQPGVVMMEQYQDKLTIFNKYGNREWVTNIKNNIAPNQRQSMQRKALIVYIQTKLRKIKKIDNSSALFAIQENPKENRRLFNNNGANYNNWEEVK